MALFIIFTEMHSFTDINVIYKILINDFRELPMTNQVIRTKMSFPAFSDSVKPADLCAAALSTTYHVTISTTYT